jgi:uncharacterized protein
MKPKCKPVFLLFAAGLLLFITAAIPVFALEGPPSDYVEDRAGIIDAQTKAGLSARLKALNDKTGVQMVILTVPTTDGIPIEEYSIERAQKWGIGQKGKDNGILFVIAINDKKYRIEVGYGLESIMPDSLAGTIGRQYLVPKFKRGDFSGGINDAANNLIWTIAKVYGTEIEGTASPIPTSGIIKKNVFSLFIKSIIKKVAPIIIAFILIFIIKIFMFPFRRGSFGRRTGGIWIGGGGFGGGGGGFGGGFSGGGGGFGGGGASGGW